MREPRHTPMSPATGAPARTAIKFPSPLKVVVGVGRGLIEGALPLIILVAILAVFWEVMTIVRFVTAPYGFGVVTLPALTVIAVGGLIISIIVFTVAGLRSLRNVRDRHLEGDYIESTVAMVVLAISLIIIFAQIWGTMGMVQHPAP